MTSTEHHKTLPITCKYASTWSYIWCKRDNHAVFAGVSGAAGGARRKSGGVTVPDSRAKPGRPQGGKNDFNPYVYTHSDFSVILHSE